MSDSAAHFRFCAPLAAGHGVVPLVILAAGLAAPGASTSQAGSSPTDRLAAVVTWDPPSPGEGELFVVHVQQQADDEIVLIAGTARQEALHFRPSGEGRFESLAAVPLGVQSTVTVSLTVIYAEGRQEVLTTAVPVTPGVYNHRRLTVAPELGAPPDSAQRVRRAREVARAAEVSAAAHRTPKMWTDQVVLPKQVDRITSGFGDGRIFNGQVSSRHTGLDLDGETGDTVVAAARGIVALVDRFELAGNMVYINHGAGLVTAYFHLSEQLVSEGDTVEAGTPIGRVGATGRVTGPHLHWVVRYGRTSVDPRSLLALNHKE